MPDHPNPHGDDQGTRVGSPDPGDPSRRNQSSGATGAGSEAAEGVHGASAERDPSDRSSVGDAPTGSEGDRAGSEPLIDRETEHRSGYGGSGGKPVRSSDQRGREGSRGS
jgi:hypothetical protein